MSESRRLIVNADDFALHPSVNRAILLAHREGIVTSTTILAGGATEENCSTSQMTER
jgi:predicted glycoside hydrolase/deacetylase ChbG (UPF0249 family)